MKICIPTYKRSHNQITLQSIPDQLLSSTYLFCNKFEEKDLQEYNVNVVVMPDDIKGIGRVRQFILDYNYDSDKILYLDDDLTFLRRDDGTTKLRKIGKENFLELYNWFIKQLDKNYGIAGLSMQGGNNRYEGNSVEFGRIYSVYALKISTLKNHNIRFDEIEVMEDFNVVLDLLRHGYRSIINTQFAHTQKASNQPGGCSDSGRTKEVQESSAIYLAGKHAPFVMLVKKKSKNWVGMEERVDVRISWKKAYREGNYLQMSKG